ncbi:TonB-linked outer membrane protein, SusC/RagA family [Capnocytophaga haemolytica]|uniref:TonB-linked outer membrane protein, SusC/RagA family n=1 Tax=Capnocytophaga haemolytica TaxID=45243 RepID=A0AAX2H158_9FLAO|nr:SusC/RagA family TonB-linked outer membrane protein [Capnocytophaga haemolytica]SFO26834.1 TonB-linked outer membrane protein, SusC/RagA family [Capnocytophaga haemolytica]SNV14975.1 TonB-linked outer membrane protein, SusC/RagA family [Capnocytophaga haemolytica]
MLLLYAFVGLSTYNSGSQEPLVVVDGIQSSMSVIDAMDPYEIESINLLKDASATAVYGVKGANGVIIVTTKRGRTGAPKVNATYNFGMSELATQMELLNSYEYALFRNEAIRNDNDPSKFGMLFSESGFHNELWKFKNNRDYTPEEVEAMNLTPEQKQALLNSPALYYTSHNYFKEAFGGIAPQNQVNLNVSGGSEKTRYFTSVGYMNQGGSFTNTKYGGADINSKYQRYNFRSNFDFDLTDNTNLTLDLSAISSKIGGIMGGETNDETSEGSRRKGMLVHILSNPPYAGPGIVNGKLVYDFVGGMNPLAGKGGTGYSVLSALLTRPYLTTYNTNLNINLKLKHKLNYLLEGLSVSGTFSYNDTYTKGVRRERTVPTYVATRNPNNPSEILFFDGKLKPTNVTDNYSQYKWRRLYFELATNYEQTFGKHGFTALLLANGQKTHDPGLEYAVPAGLMGLAARATYDYDHRYLLEANMGYNGTENFAPGKRFGFFPAFSLGWVVSNEKFIPENNIVTYLKIRGSYGEVGNDQVGGRRFLYQPSTWGYGFEGYKNQDMGAGGYYFGNTNGSTRDPFYMGAWENRVGNPNVTWERAKKSNLGVELNMFKDKLTIVADLFREKRDNILWSRGTVPGIVGSDLPAVNIGKVSNSGYEAQVHWADKIGSFTYGVGFNVSYAKNKIDFRDEPNNPYPWMNETGYSIGQYKGFLTNGFYNTWEEVMQLPYSRFDGNKVQPGDLRYVDVNGDGVIDEKDRVPIGYSNLPRYSFGANLNLGYKGFGLAVLFTGTAQGSMPIDYYMRSPFEQGKGAAFKYQYEGRWTPEKIQKGIKPTYPRASLRTEDNINGKASDFWLQSTDHIRLKNVELSYLFEKTQWLQKNGITSIKLSVSGNNLYTWSNMIAGYDPEQQDSSDAAKGYLYPMMRTYSAGLNIQF